MLPQLQVTGFPPDEARICVKGGLSHLRGSETLRNGVLKPGVGPKNENPPFLRGSAKFDLGTHFPCRAKENTVPRKQPLIWPLLGPK